MSRGGLLDVKTFLNEVINVELLTEEIYSTGITHISVKALHPVFRQVLDHYNESQTFQAMSVNILGK